jgi:hypothetical protein
MSTILGLFTAPTVKDFLIQQQQLQSPSSMVAQPPGTSFNDYVQQLISQQPANVKDGLFYNPGRDALEASKKAASVLQPGFSAATTPSEGGDGGAQVGGSGQSGSTGIGIGALTDANQAAAMQAAMSMGKTGMQYGGLLGGLVGAGYGYGSTLGGLNADALASFNASPDPLGAMIEAQGWSPGSAVSGTYGGMSEEGYTDPSGGMDSTSATSESEQDGADSAGYGW